MQIVKRSPLWDIKRESQFWEMIYISQYNCEFILRIVTLQLWESQQWGWKTVVCKNHNFKSHIEQDLNYETKPQILLEIK